MLLVHPNDHDTSPSLGLRILEPPAIILGAHMGRNDGLSVFDDPLSQKSSAAAVCPHPPMTIDTTESTPQRIEEGRPCSVMGSLYRIAQRGFKPSFAVENGTGEPGSHNWILPPLQSPMRSTWPGLHGRLTLSPLSGGNLAV